MERIVVLRHAATGRLDEIHIDDDGTARRIAAGFALCGRVDLDEYVTADASEPPPASAGDGPREVLDSAGAHEGHGWSVSATRTIGNVPEAGRPLSTGALR